MEPTMQACLYPNPCTFFIHVVERTKRQLHETANAPNSSNQTKLSKFLFVICQSLLPTLVISSILSLARNLSSPLLCKVHTSCSTRYNYITSSASNRRCMKLNRGFSVYCYQGLDQRTSFCGKRTPAGEVLSYLRQNVQLSRWKSGLLIATTK